MKIKKMYHCSILSVCKSFQQFLNKKQTKKIQKKVWRCKQLYTPNAQLHLWHSLLHNYYLFSVLLEVK